MTPYEKFKSLPEAKQCLKAGISFEQLDQVAMQESDLSLARKVQKAREKLFQVIAKKV